MGGVKTAGRGTAGIIVFAPDTVTLQQPAEPRVARALSLLIDQVNAVPPSMQGDRRLIAYQLAANLTI